MVNVTSMSPNLAWPLGPCKIVVLWSLVDRGPVSWWVSQRNGDRLEENAEVCSRKEIGAPCPQQVNHYYLFATSIF